MATNTPIASATYALSMAGHLHETYNETTGQSRSTGWTLGGLGMEVSAFVSPDQSAGGWSVSVSIFVDGEDIGRASGWSAEPHIDARQFLRSDTLTATVLRAFARAERSVPVPS